MFLPHPKILKPLTPRSPMAAILASIQSKRQGEFFIRILAVILCRLSVPDYPLRQPRKEGKSHMKMDARQKKTTQPILQRNFSDCIFLFTLHHTVVKLIGQPLLFRGPIAWPREIQDSTWIGLMTLPQTSNNVLIK